MPQDGELAGLLALMLLTQARRTARVSTSGEMVPSTSRSVGLGRGAGRRGSSAGARAPGRRSGSGSLPDPCRDQRRAHLGPDFRDTDWSQVVALHDRLVRLDPSPIVVLIRAVAIAELDGPDVAPAIVDRLQGELVDYHAYWAARADILRRLGRIEESRAAYGPAIALAGNTAETA